MGKAGVTLHLGRVLVRQRQAIDAIAGVGAAALELGDHRLAAARIARRRVEAERPVDGNQPGAYQRRDQRQESGGVAARVRHPPRLGDPPRLVGRQFGEAIGPAVGDAVSGGGVDDPGPVVVDQRHRLAGGVVGQAQDDDVGVVERLSPRRRLLALRLVQHHQRDLGPVRQAVADLQPGGAGGAVDEDGDAHGSPSAAAST